MKIPVQEIIHHLGEAQNIIITAHKNPDGDALGSTLGLYHALQNAGKNCTVVLPDGFPSFIAWMPSADKILLFDSMKEKVVEQFKKADLVFCLDYNSLDRTGELSAIIQDCPAPRILIDHHPFPSDEFNVLYSDIFPSSTSEMVVEMLLAVQWGQMIDEKSATCLYTGIVTDTGSFRFSCTSSRTHEIAGQLIQRGAANAHIHDLLFDTQSESRLKLLGYALSEKMIVNHALKTAYIVLTQAELKRFHYRKGDTEGMVNYGLAIQGIKVAAIFVEHEELIKISLRSKGKVPVNELSRNNFSGGGHTNAAGGKWEGDLESLLKKWNEVLPPFINEHGEK